MGGADHVGCLSLKSLTVLYYLRVQSMPMLGGLKVKHLNALI